jgi:hypothetical protein
MWAQGLAYGRASALLERRYPQPGATLATTTTTTGSQHRNPIRTAISLVAENRSLGAFLWSLGWHVGHRGGRNLTAPAAPMPIGSRAPRAS